MKNNKGIQCKVNNYHVTGIAIVDGNPQSVTFESPFRDARLAKKLVADQLNIKASQVLVNFELEKRAFTINCTYDELMNALGAANIPVEFAADASEDNE